MFLTLVAAILLFAISTIGVISQQYIFGKVEPAFVGALVGASGTIFAGCIAYQAASQNVSIAEMARADAVKERDALTAKVAKDAQDAKQAELQAVQALKQNVDRIVEQFDGSTDVGDKDYFQHLFDAQQYGLLNLRIRRGIPEDLAVKAIDVLDPLQGLRDFGYERSGNACTWRTAGPFR